MWCIVFAAILHSFEPCEPNNHNDWMQYMADIKLYSKSEWDINSLKHLTDLQWQYWDANWTGEVYTYNRKEK